MALVVSRPLWSAQVEEPLKAALELHESGKIREALAEYDKVIKAHPKLAEAYFNRGNAYYRSWPESASDQGLQPGDSLNPKDAEAYFNRANAYRRLKQVGTGVERL